jgi:hypothetical protein
VRRKLARFIARGPQCARRSRKKRTLTEWQIKRTIERFKLWQIQKLLDGCTWPEAAAVVQELEILLRAGIRPSRHLTDAITYGDTDLGLVSKGHNEEEFEEEDWHEGWAQRWANYFYQRFRNEYAEVFYGGVRTCCRGEVK